MESLPTEGFRLVLAARGSVLAHGDSQGLRYGRACLRQLRSQSGARLPALAIEDAPDFPVRGLLLDVSRDRVPTRETLARLVELLGLLRLNHLQLYTEHTFAYRAHERVWRDASPLDADDVRWLDARCAENGIELAANQSTFGHMGRWLQHAAYRGRAECPDGYATRSGARRPPGCLAPTPENAAFALSLCRELLAAHTSRRINVNGDETFELGRGASQAEAASRGRERVYLEHLRRIVDPLREEGCDVLFWGDVLRDHAGLLRELPRERLTALVWHYEAPQRELALPPGPWIGQLAEYGITPRSLQGFESQVEAFVDAGLPFWVCPGTSSWNSFAGRWSNARANLLDAARAGRAHGARGYLITDWGDNGHLQPPSVSWLPLAFGAAVAWGLDANAELDPAPALDAFAFEDEERALGGALTRLAELYRWPGPRALNASPLFGALVRAGLGAFGALQSEGLERVDAELAAARAALAQARPRCADGALVVRELAQAARLCELGALALARAAGLSARAPDFAALLAEATEEQRTCWLARSRPGGLADSLARLAPRS